MYYYYNDGALDNNIRSMFIEDSEGHVQDVTFVEEIILVVEIAGAESSAFHAFAQALV